MFRHQYPKWVQNPLFVPEMTKISQPLHIGVLLGFEHLPFKAIYGRLHRVKKVIHWILTSVLNILPQKCSKLKKFAHERFYKEVSFFKKIARFPKVLAHTCLTILDYRKRKRRHKVTKLTSYMNFRMIQAVIKCYERSRVKRIEENSNEVSLAGRI